MDYFMVYYEDEVQERFDKQILTYDEKTYTLFVFLENLEILKFQDSVYQLRRSGSQGGCAILTVCILPYHPDLHIPF